MNISASIIIPVFNDGKALEQTLKEILKQNFLPGRFEVIIVDNGSTDDTASLMEKYTTDEKIIFIDEARFTASPYSARNRGIEIAKGETIILLDATCTPSTTWLYEGLQYLLNSRADIVGGKVIFEFRDRVTAAKVYDSITNIKMKESIRERKVAVTANLFIRKEVFDNIGLFPEGVRSGGDLRWTGRASKKGYSIKYCESAVVYKPARDFRALVKKQWRVGLGQPAIWQEHGQIIIFLKMLATAFFPTKPGSVRYMISKRGTPEMERFLFKLIIIDHLIRLIMVAANCLGMLRLAGSILFNDRRRPYQKISD